MRIALRATALLSALTGIGHYVRSLALALQRIDVDLHLFYGGPWSTQVRQAPLPGMGSARNLVRRFVPRPHYLFRAIEQVGFSIGTRARAIDLYHEPAFLPLRYGGPTVVTAHDLSWLRYPETHPAERVAVMNDLFPRVLARVDHVITDAEFVRSEVITTFGLDPARITAIPLAARDVFSPRTAAQTRATLARHSVEHRRYLLSVGTLEPRKNLVAVLRAYARLGASVQERYPLLVVGMSGWHASELGALAAPLVERGAVRLLGYVDDLSLADLYASARMLVYPSIYEGFGLPPLEAMASGTPVIASDASTLPEVVGDAGILVHPQDDDALLQSISMLAQDDALWERLRAAGLVRAQTFSWQTCAVSTLKVYQQVLARC